MTQTFIRTSCLLFTISYLIFSSSVYAVFLEYDETEQSLTVKCKQERVKTTQDQEKIRTGKATIFQRKSSGEINVYQLISWFDQKEFGPLSTLRFCEADNSTHQVLTELINMLGRRNKINATTTLIHDLPYAIRLTDHLPAPIQHEVVKPIYQHPEQDSPKINHVVNNNDESSEEDPYSTIKETGEVR